MKKNVQSVRKIVLGSIYLLFILPALFSQSTIGLEEPPVDGALLQAKNISGIADGSANATKGIAFPRVHLTNTTELYPMYSAADPVYLANKVALKQQHTGMIVYNVNGNAPFNKTGIFVWTGVDWGSVEVPDVLNALSVGDATVKLGGNLTENTSITQNGYSFHVTTDNTKRLNINGSMRTDSLFIKTQPEETNGNSRTLVWNEYTKRIESAAGNVASMLFLQSRNTTTLAIGTVTAETSYTVPWAVTDLSNSIGGDVVTNNLMDYHSTDNSFSLREDAKIEISGYIGYAGTGVTGSADGAGGAAPAGSSVIVNVSLEVSTDDGVTWDKYTSVRGVYYVGMANYRQTLNIPPAMYEGNQGDRIRMRVVVKPSGLGISHSYPRIVIPDGTGFSKSFKIIAQ